MLDGLRDSNVQRSHAAVPRAGRQSAEHPSQRTLKTSIHCNGVGLHSGEVISLSLHPAPTDTGIVFRRNGVTRSGASVAARFDNVVDTRMCTRIENEQGVSIGTIEHLMAALHGCAVDNAVIEVSGPEVPIMDGSSEPFVFLIECAGIVDQDAPRRMVRVTRRVEVRNNDRVAVLDPADRFSAFVGIDFASTAIGCQEISLDLTPSRFKTEIARARTFGFLDEVETLRSMGLARGGSLENAVVVDGDTIVNEEGLRYRDEFVRHKLLDCLGDLYLAGHPIIGHFHSIRAGHCINNELLRAVFFDPANWELVGVEEESQKAEDLAVAASA